MAHQFTYYMDDVPNVGYRWRLNKRESRYPTSQIPVEVIDFAVNDEEEVEEMGIEVDAEFSDGEHLYMWCAGGQGKNGNELKTSKAREGKALATYAMEGHVSHVGIIVVLDIELPKHIIASAIIAITGRLRLLGQPTTHQGSVTPQDAACFQNNDNM
ncbi:hypothetical protein B0H11DRAFT_1898428 [Mycena galericulata]|nr:hypothetical protein B0H11DRAFT_1898428 [Mycena galericulata]